MPAPVISLYGVRAWGSGIAEALLAAAGLPYAFIDVAGFDRPGPVRDRLIALNPLAQVPTLVLPDGQVLTETAAIALWCADQNPILAPPPGDPDRARFLRLLIWLVANLYPTFTYGDYPERWAPSAPAELVARTDAYRERLLLWLEDQVTGPFMLGTRFSALDLYPPLLIHWRPRHDWFVAHTPKLVAIAAHVATLPALAAVLATNRTATPPID